MQIAEEHYKKALLAARSAGQEHIFAHWDHLNETQKNNLLQQVAQIDFSQLKSLATDYIFSKKSVQSDNVALEPVQPVALPETEQDFSDVSRYKKIGEESIRAGKIGCLLVAGGQGSRLGFDGPKGMYPISPVKEKTFFQLIAEKIIATNRQYETNIPWYIMTSMSNYEATTRFFKENNNFGIDPDSIFFFRQRMMPALAENGTIIMEACDRIFMNPDGHGGIIHALHESGAVDDIIRRGLEHLFYFQIDNVLIQICDPVFVGRHVAGGGEMSTKIIEKRDAFEKVGVIGKIDGKLGVIEYSDLSEEEMHAKTTDGKLLFSAGNLAIHMFATKFLKAIASSKIQLPWHLAHKNIPFVDEKCRRIEPEAPNGYKFEKFIFDALPLAKDGVVMEVERAQEFSPVKGATGVDSAQTARQDMISVFREWVIAAGFELPDDDRAKKIKLEISPLYALDKESFLARTKKTYRLEQDTYFE